MITKYQVSNIKYQVSSVNARRMIPITRYPLLVTFLLFAIYYSLFTDFAFASQAHDEALRIQKAYENITDIRGDFIQKSHIRDLKRTDTHMGRFFIKPPKMKWEYRGDNPQTVFVTEDHIIIYQIKQRQAFQTKFDRASYGQAPIALLGGFGNIKNEFDITPKTKNTLILKPKGPMGNISYIEIIISDEEFPAFPIQAITIVDNRSNTVTIELQNVRINTGLKDRIFEFLPPENVRIFRR